MRLEPTNIQQIGGELAISWNDGSESFFKLETLRRACPCAACGGEPDVLGNISRPQVTYTDESFRLAGFDLVIVLRLVMIARRQWIVASVSFVMAAVFAAS